MEQAMKKIRLVLLLAFLVLNIGCESNRRLSRPLIGITSVYQARQQENSGPSVSVDFYYIQAVVENGGLPIILPTIKQKEVLRQYVEQLDGLVLIGGADVPPSAYGEQPHDTVKAMPVQRYEFESRLIDLWLESGKPLLGICLGMQFTNVVLGGTLIQDIPSQVGTEVVHRGNDAHHWVRIEPNTRLAEILGAEEAKVNSNHHQAVKGVGRGLKVVARSSDGVIEALEKAEGGFGLFVQWHPESMTGDMAHRKAIFGELVRCCSVQNNAVRRY